MATIVTVRGGLQSAADAAAAWRAVFPEPGLYEVHCCPWFVKAASVEEGDSFSEWFLQQLYEVTRQRIQTAQEAIWTVLDRYLQSRGVEAPSQLDHWDLQRRLFDLSQASTARMVGIRVPAAVTERLTAMGWKPAEILDFPALAYRMGRVYQELEAMKPVAWETLVEHVSSRPLGSIERAAIEHARNRAGVFMKPIFDETGAVWTAEREIAPLRQVVTAAQEARQGPRAAARELGKSQRAQGVFRDAERVTRTEMAEASNRGNWEVAAKRWGADDLLYRPTSSRPCKVCLRLFKMPDGMPRLYTRAEVEAGDALGINTGPSKDWHVRIGPIHPHCVCGPWTKWHEALRPVVARRAAEFARMIAELKVFKEAA